MSPRTRIWRIHLPRFVVATIAIVSVLWSFRLTMTNVVAGGGGRDLAAAGAHVLAWLGVPSTASNWVAGTGPRQEPPLYGMIMVILSTFVGELDLAGVLISFFSWAATIPLFFFLCKRLNGVKAAYLSTVLLSTNRWMIGASYIMLQSSLYILLSISCLFVSVQLVGLLRGHKGRVSTRLLILSGSASLLFILLFLTRSEGLVVFACVFVFLGLWAALQRRRDIGIAIIAMMVVFLVISGPFFLYVKQHSGHWVFPAQVNVVTVTVGYLEKATLGEYFHRHFMGNALEYYEMYKKMLGPIGTVMIMLLGLMAILPPITLDKVQLEQLLPLLFLTPLLGLFAYKPNSKYALPYLPILIMWVGRGAIELGQSLPKRYATPAIASVLIAFSVFYAWEVRFWPHSHLHLTFKATGLWMKENLARDLENEMILGGKGAYMASLYANTGLTDPEYLRTSDPEQVVKYMRANNIRYLLVDAHYTPLNYPNLAFLVTDVEAARNLGLTVVHEEDGQTNKSVLYEVQLDTPP